MEVLIPCTDATGTQSRLYIPYGQAPFFALWDSATDQLEFQSNPLAGQAHACACSTTHWMQRAGANVLITGDMGRQAAQRLQEAGIEVLHAPADSLGELLARYRHSSLFPAPTSEPRWLCHGTGRAEQHAQRHVAHRHGGKGECCGAHEGPAISGTPWTGRPRRRLLPLGLKPRCCDAAFGQSARNAAQANSTPEGALY